MFSVKRFNAFGASDGQDDESISAAKLQALNERILKKRKLVGDVVPAPQANTATLVSTPAPPKVANPLNIHPSRLQAAPLLRQSVKKVQSGLPKEKTKAKERYLRAKKERRKARKKATPKKKNDPGTSSERHDDQLALPEEEALNRFVAEQQANLDPYADRAASSEQTSDPEDDSDTSEEVTRPASEPGAADSDSGTYKTLASQKGQLESLVENSEDRNGKESYANSTLVPNKQEAIGLERFPAAGVKRAVDPKLISSLGLPEGLSNRTVVDPSLSRPLQLAASTVTHSTNRADDRSEFVESADSSESDNFAQVAISDTVRQRLEALGITEWFAVQVSVIPYLLAQPDRRYLYRPFAPPRDLCVSAPTGSGKTLAYAVPIIEILRSRQVVRLRALIVLPTRDLVSQVRNTMELIGKGSGLRIATATGHHSFSHEQSQIVSEDGKGSKVDILIATPGRLIDHLDSTPGFTLSHLRFLVIDEADRLLNQSFQEWLQRVLSATESQSSTSASIAIGSTAQAPSQLYAGELASVSALTQEEVWPSVQKLLFSATLTRDPAKIASLGLRHPHYITIQDSEAETGIVHHERFSLPHSLHEHMFITTSQDKPFHFLHLLHRAEAPVRQALCFTKSVESAGRLVKLVELFEDVRAEAAAKLYIKLYHRLVVQNYSSELRPLERRRVLAEFADGKIDLLVCSDLISRGIDLPSVRHVVSYDAPIDPAKYVHRVGRTARAGKEGDAWTLVEEQEARHFKSMVRSVGRQSPIGKIKLNTEELDKLRPDYEEALDRLAKFYRNSDNGGGNGAKG